MTAAGEGAEEEAGQEQGDDPRQAHEEAAKGLAPDAVRSLHHLPAAGREEKQHQRRPRGEQRELRPQHQPRGEAEVDRRAFEQGEPGAGRVGIGDHAAVRVGAAGRADRAADHEDVPAHPRRGGEPHVPPQHDDVARDPAGDVDRAVHGGHVGQGLARDDDIPSHGHHLVGHAALLDAEGGLGALGHRRDRRDRREGRGRQHQRQDRKKKFHGAHSETKRPVREALSSFQCSCPSGPSGWRRPPGAGGGSARSAGGSGRAPGTQRPRGLPARRSPPRTGARIPFQEAASRPAPAKRAAWNMLPTASSADTPEGSADGPATIKAAARPPSSTNTAAGKRQVRGERASQPAGWIDAITVSLKSDRTAKAELRNRPSRAASSSRSLRHSAQEARCSFKRVRSSPASRPSASRSNHSRYVL